MDRYVQKLALDTRIRVAEPNERESVLKAGVHSIPERREAVAYARSFELRDGCLPAPWSHASCLIRVLAQHRHFRLRAPSLLLLQWLPAHQH